MLKYVTAVAVFFCYFSLVLCAPMPGPGGALQTTSYCANYTSEGKDVPCASISGSHIVTQNCNEANLTDALQDFLRTVCGIVNTAGNGPSGKKLDVVVTSNLTYVPPSFDTDCCEPEGEQPPPDAIPKPVGHYHDEDASGHMDTGRDSGEDE